MFCYCCFSEQTQVNASGNLQTMCSFETCYTEILYEKKHLEMTGISVMSALLYNQAIIDPQISGKYLQLLGQTKRRPDLMINNKLDISSLCLCHLLILSELL